MISSAHWSNWYLLSSIIPQSWVTIMFVNSTLIFFIFLQCQNDCLSNFILRLLIKILISNCRYFIFGLTIMSNINWRTIKECRRSYIWKCQQHAGACWLNFNNVGLKSARITMSLTLWLNPICVICGLPMTAQPYPCLIGQLLWCRWQSSLKKMGYLYVY